MDWQQPAALAVVGFTATLIVLARVRRLRRGSHTCTSGCRCPALENTGDKPYLASPSHRPEKTS